MDDNIEESTENGCARAVFASTGTLDREIMDRFGKLVAGSGCRPARERPPRERCSGPPPVAGVTALLLGCVVGLPLAWETGQTKATAQTIASVPASEIADPSPPSRDKDLRPASVLGDPDRDIDSIRRNLIATLDAVRELRAEPSAVVGRPPTRGLRQPQNHGVPAGEAGTAGGDLVESPSVLARRINSRAESAEENVIAIQKNLASTLLALEELQEQELAGAGPPSASRSEERRVGKEGRSRWSPYQ